MPDIRSYFRSRAAFIALAALLGVASGVGLSPARSHDLQGLQEVLGGKELLVTGVAWEPSRGRVHDLLIGRPVLFEAARIDGPNQRRDIHRAFVRLSPEGRVIDVRKRRNLTQTRSADEYGLGSKGSLAWFGTGGDQAPGSVTFLNLEGEVVQKAQHGILGRIQLGLSRFLETGTWSGIGKTDLLSERGELTITFGDEVEIAGDGWHETFDEEELFRGPSESPHLAHLRFLPRARKPSNWLHWAADVGRHFFGVGAIAWAEGRAFSLWDNLHKVSHSVTSSNKTTTPQKRATPPKNASTQIWPPENIPVDGSTEDGKWVPVDREILPKTSTPLFYRTVLHPDPERPYAEIHLVAFDMRRLELGIGAGYEDPRPDTGPAGSGQVPEQVGPQVVATFNGAFKSEHGQYGMKAEGRLLVEPVVGAATVRIDKSGSAGLGTWQPGDESSALVAFRQNLDPLVADGKPNPTGRKVWGDQLYGAGIAVERSALCYHTSGQLLYAWGTEATAQSLAEGLAAAGCVYAIHLDMNPGHCSFLFNRVKSIDPLVARGEPLDARMRVNPTRFLRWSPKDFFYLKLRGHVPDGGEIAWSRAPGQQPSPDAIPAILLGKKTVGDLAIEFDRVDTHRFAFSLSPGSAESQKDLEDLEGEGEALIGWGLGHRTRGHRPGLALGDSVIVPLHRNYASLVIEEGNLALLPPAEPQTERAGLEIAQLPALARDGQLLPAARELGGKRVRSVMCIDEVGTLLVARMEHDTPAPLAQALLDLGCRLVVELDRGSHPPPHVERAGHSPGSGGENEQTLLEARGIPMRPLTHLF